MRTAMICASIMLAVVQLWLAMAGAPAASHPRHVVAAPVPAAPPLLTQLVDAAGPLIKLTEREPQPIACGVLLQRAVQACRRGDRACQTAASDHAELCEAKGLWPG